MIHGEDITTTSDQLLSRCRIVQTFFESTDFSRFRTEIRGRGVRRRADA